MPKYTPSVSFKEPSSRTAEILEYYGLKACLNVIATGQKKRFDTDPRWILQEILGDFDDWNALKARGHEIMPQSWHHLDLTKLPLEKAKRNIDKCLHYFEKHLEGYHASAAV